MKIALYKTLNLCEKQKKEIVELYNSGISITTIIKTLGFNITDKYFYYFLKKHNILINRKNKIKNNITGKRFGYLTVLRMERNEKSTKGNPWRAICQCDKCGNQNFNANKYALLKGKTTSCGCNTYNHTKNTGKNSKSYKGYEELDGTYWGKIIKRAEDIGQLFNIDIKYAWDLYIKQNRKCSLSGLPIVFRKSSKDRSSGTASLDRIDSKKGYVEGNVQWIHKHINIMKNAYSQEYFISLCKIIGEHNDE